jgi:hypothetical protein
MLKTIRHLRTPLALSAALIVGACADKKSNDTAGDALATDTAALSRDLALAGRDSAALPALNDVPAPAVTEPAAAPAPAPVRTIPRPRATTPAPRPRTTTPAAPAAPRTTPSGNTVESNTGGSAASSGGGAVGSIAAGSSISLTSNSRVCTNTYQVGQTFTATVAETVTGSNGASIPAGSTAKLEVTELNRSENANDPVKIGARLVSVNVGGRSYAVSGTATDMNVDRVRNQPRGKDAQKVATGAVIGGILGQVLGKDTKGTVIGAATGAAAGAATAAATANYEGCVPSGGRIVVRLNDAAQIRAE